MRVRVHAHAYTTPCCMKISFRWAPFSKEWLTDWLTDWMNEWMNEYAPYLSPVSMCCTSEDMRGKHQYTVTLPPHICCNIGSVPTSLHCTSIATNNALWYSNPEVKFPTLSLIRYWLHAGVSNKLFVCKVGRNRPHCMLQLLVNVCQTSYLEFW
jgi:hypothetical protein